MMWKNLEGKSSLTERNIIQINTNAKNVYNQWFIARVLFKSAEFTLVKFPIIIYLLAYKNNFARKYCKILTIWH
jgi:hypothetical protein